MWRNPTATPVSPEHIVTRKTKKDGIKRAENPRKKGLEVKIFARFARGFTHELKSCARHYSLVAPSRFNLD